MIAAPKRSPRAEPRRRRGGFTLVELLVVVAVLGILSTVAVFTVDTDPDLRSVVRDVQSRIEEGSRTAVAGGPVRPDVVEAEGRTERARVQISSHDEGPQYVAVALRVEEEDAAESAWRHVSHANLPENVEVYGYEDDAARLSPGGEPVPKDGPIEVFCEPTGSCGPLTLYLQNERGTEQMRIAVLRFGGAPITARGW